VLGGLFRQLKTPRKAAEQPTVGIRPGVPAVLNVGGNSKAIPIPGHYAGWQHLLLDIDATRDADIVCDARTLTRLDPAQFDAVYCSHNLEHYYRHDVPRVLAGFLHVLKPQGFAEIRVPDLAQVFRKVTEGGLDLENELYVSPAGPITVLDVVYGWSAEIERSGQDFFAHKTGFTAATLTSTLQRAGFGEIWMAPLLGVYELRAIAFKERAGVEQRKLLGIPLDAPAG
jgi:SAM-dependent methyltransferase